MALKGLEDVVANLRAAIKDIEGVTEAGVKEAVIFVKGEALEITPHDKGFLIGSAFHDTELTPGVGVAGRVGYTAEYAPWVHELRDPYIPKADLVGPSQPRFSNFIGPKRHGSRGTKRGKTTFKFVGPRQSRSGKARRSMAAQSVNWSKPGTGNKFLEKALNNNHDEILSIIRDNAVLP